MRPTPEELEQLIAWRRMGGGPFGGAGPFGRGGGRVAVPEGAAGHAAATCGSRSCACWPSSPPTAISSCRPSRSAATAGGAPARSVYPTLAQLEDEGLIKSVEADGSRRFEITDAGRQHLESRVDEPEPWKPADEEGENAITELAPLVIQIGKAAWQVATVGDEAQRARATEILAETRRALYRILADDARQDDAPDTDESEV